MLVLTRKQSEMIQIGDDIVISVIHVGRQTVKIGIQAPTAIRVLRLELCDPPAPGHPLAQFLSERRAIRTGRRQPVVPGPIAPRHKPETV